MYDEIKTEKVRLEKKEFGHKRVINKMIKDKTDINIEERGMEEVITGIVRLLGRDLRDIRIKYPKNWIEAVKDRFLPEWLKQYIPVRYKTHNIEAMELYPKISLPEKDHLIVQKHNQSEYKNKGVYWEDE